MREHTTQREVAMTIGLDLGDRFSHFCVVDAAGEVDAEGRVKTTTPALESWLRSRAPSRFAIEAGTHSPWVSRLIAACGHEVLVANPAKFRLIHRNPTKNDRLDAERLARVARMDPRLLSPIHHRGAQAQADLALVRARQAVVRTRATLVNHVRGSVKAFGARLPKCSTPAFGQKVALHIPVELQPALDDILLEIRQLTALIRRYDRRIVQLAEIRYPQTAVLQQVVGVGPVTALAYVLILEDPNRFRKSRDVGPYLGLTPRQDTSGDKDPQLRITKTGDTLLRSLLVQGAHYILGPFGPDTDLRRKGLTLAARGGKNAKRRAVIAVTRKLAVLLHRLWITGELYEPLRNTESTLDSLAKV